MTHTPIAGLMFEPVKIRFKKGVPVGLHLYGKISATEL
jgi:hypothetical protein